MLEVVDPYRVPAIAPMIPNMHPRIIPGIICILIFLLSGRISSHVSGCKLLHAKLVFLIVFDSIYHKNRVN